MGSPDFAVPSLDALYHSHHRILAVASNPDKRRGRRSRPEPTDVKKRALELGLPVIDVEDVKSDTFETRLRELAPDLLVVVAFRILPAHILAVPRLGSVNLHASLLPKYRGAAPIHHAIMQGEQETGCTVFFLDEKVDTGEIIGQAKTDIGPDETTGEVYNRLKHLGAELLLETVQEIADDTAKPVKQNHSAATPAPKLFSENTRIDFSEKSTDIHNFIRGLNPFPVAWCKYGDQKMNIYLSRPAGSEVPESLKLSPGELAAHDSRLFAGCGDGVLELLVVQLPGTKKMTGTEFVNGYGLDKKLS
ncbi:methionyl-tRNA formyltransferase [Rhodohalobacter mucosus]|uniref:Methionyl-tRNA formyltransferase n=2 Tax=Rhodohalobacter mucosus TaxID=2079485 RepID=A0A316TMW0_9BACT|nr:methionyl-tRNA formyltransferase [Rhodohalobacter mucosus]